MLLTAKGKSGFWKTLWGIVVLLCSRDVSGDMVYKYIRFKNCTVKKFVSVCVGRTLALWFPSSIFKDRTAIILQILYPVLQSSQLNKTQEKEKKERYIKRKYLNRDITFGLHTYYILGF